MIIDTSFYCGEENILELRLNTLNDYVDKFLLLESPKSHSLIPRELEYPKQQERFSKFKDKIVYISTNYCINKVALMNDWIGRDVIQDILINELKINSDDTILHGDLDEIPRVEKLKSILDYDKQIIRPYTFMMDNRILTFDLEPIEQPGKFPGTILLKGKYLTKNRLHWLRQIRANPTIEGVKYDYFNIIQNGGFHFSYNAGIERTIDKFRFYSHHDDTLTWTKDRDSLINCIKTKTGFTSDKDKLKVIEWKEENYPAEIWNNKEKYKENLSNYYS